MCVGFVALLHLTTQKKQPHNPPPKKQQQQQDAAATAAEALLAAGHTDVKLLAGGFVAWDRAYRPDGRRRASGNFRDRSSGELEWWTASN